MAAAYARKILRVAEPRVGLVSIGEEAGKGSALVKEAGQLIQADRKLHFLGNVEGRDLFAGDCDVFVCDGFVGNVILKLTEGLAEGLFKTISAEFEQEDQNLARRFRPIVERIWKRHDFAEYGGAPLLGVNSVVMICHGRSDQRAIRNSIRAATKEIQTNLNAFIAEQMLSTVEGAV
jgi:glycerol-3-phosphate acyltransferase PlsX